MVDLKASNHKLAGRARRVLRTIVAAAADDNLNGQGAKGDLLDPQHKLSSDVEVDTLLRECFGSVKLAAVVCLKGVNPMKGQSLLEAHHGRLKEVLDQRLA